VISPGTGVKVFLACGVTDMRKGIAGLSAVAQNVLHENPCSGAVFAFRGRRGDRVKLLYWVSHCHAIGPRDNGARGILPVLQGAGERPVSLAIACGRNGASHRRTVGHALGRH